MEIPDMETLQQLQANEEMYGYRVHDWIADGMPLDTMGTPSKMDAFHDRQAARPDEVPTDIERRNNRSVQRSEKAAQKTGPAGETSVPESVRDVIASPGRALDSEIQRAMEDRMGDSFADVQIHTGPQAVRACESINARAFTVGNNIAFNRGEYDPSSPEGQHVLAHELAHVRQQTSGAVSMLPQEDVELEIDPDPTLEKEAEETAQRVMKGERLDIQRMRHTDVHVQRMSGVDKDETHDPASQAGGGSSESVAEKLDTATAEELSPAVTNVELGPENLAAFQKAVMKDIETLYDQVQEQGVLSKMADAGTGEALKMGMTKAGEHSEMPLGKAVGSLSGAALQAIYNNRGKVLEILGLKSASVDDGEAETGSGSSQADSLGK